VSTRWVQLELAGRGLSQEVMLAQVLPSRLSNDASVQRDFKLRLRAGRQNVGAKGGGQEKGEAALGRALERAQVMVDRAPKGMARSKGNATRWLNRSKQIAWSVEWRTPEGAEVQHDCLESGTLADLYGSFLRSKEPKAKKRKIRHGAKGGQDETAEEMAAPADSLHGAGDEDGGYQKDSERRPAINEENERENDSLPSPKTPLKRPTPPSIQQSTQKFYLRRPHTPSSQPTVLIPLSASETLTWAVRSHSGSPKARKS
jgi:hypothetical protein